MYNSIETNKNLKIVIEEVLLLKDLAEEGFEDCSVHLAITKAKNPVLYNRGAPNDLPRTQQI